MAKEEELKRVDLKVNVNCCEGCRRKVMKAMSLKGVLRTEIHPSLDRVTVVGNVDSKVLVKKLAKVSKIAEVVAAPLPEENKKREDNSRNDHDKPASSAEEKSKRKDMSDKAAAAAAAAASKKDCSKCTHQQAGRGDGSADRGKAPSKDAAAAGSVEEGDVYAGATPSAPEHAASSHQHYYHRAEPPTMAVPVHVPPYHAAASVTPYYYGPVPMPPPPPPPMPMPVAPHAPPPQHLRAPPRSRFDVDYFDEDNAVGCRVM